jgi:hypothetical protein
MEHNRLAQATRVREETLWPAFLGKERVNAIRRPQDGPAILGRLIAAILAINSLIPHVQIWIEGFYTTISEEEY